MPLAYICKTDDKENKKLLRAYPKLYKSDIPTVRN